MQSLFLDFIFPNSCLGCQKLISSKEIPFCLSCYCQLPFTYWKWQQNNIMYEKFKVFLPIEFANSLFYFRKGNRVQEILHTLKYRHSNTLSLWLANEYCERSGISKDDDIQCVIPVPIHRKKLKERGYNQNSKFGEYMAEKLSANYLENVLKRLKHQKSQTLMHKGRRLSRLEDTFQIHDLPDKYEHFLLIDDVCTTGATLLHCADLLLKRNKKVSIATMAFAI